MNIPLLDIVNLKTILEDKDYITLLCLSAAFILWVFNFHNYSFVFGGIAILFRVLFMKKKDRTVNPIYKSVFKRITDLKPNVHTQQEIRETDLKDWFPKIKDDILRICWKRLQKEEVILKDGYRWIIGNRTEI